MKAPILIAGAVALAAGAAIAGQYEGDDWEAKVANEFAAIDADANGALTEAEYVAYVTEKAKTEFAESAGDDGLISLAEAKASYKAKMDEKMVDMKDHHMDMDRGGDDQE